MKYANRIIIGLVIVLLILVVLLLIGVVFYNTDKKMELGSLSDWISSLSTAGTLLIAYMAYRKAPDWINTKRNETGFNHVISIMADSDKIATGLIRLYFDIINTNNQSRNFKTVLEKVEDYAYQSLLLKFRLQSCRRWKITAPPDVALFFSTLRDFCNVSQSMLTIGQSAELSDKLTSYKHDIEKYSHLFNQDIEKTFKFPRL